MSSRAAMRTVHPGAHLFDLGDAPANGHIQKWVQIAKQGTFRGHSAGEFTLDAAVFAQIISNFERTTNRRVPLDFEHASEMDASSGDIPTRGAPAQGWITQLAVRDDGNLWAFTEFGDLASEYIRKGQYRYISPAIVFGARDPVTGEKIGARLSSVAITNSPFLDAMQPLAAKRTDDAGPTPLEALRDALKMPDEATAAQCAAAFAALEASKTAGVDVAPFLMALRDALRLSLPSTWDDVRAAVAKTLSNITTPPGGGDARTETPPPIPPDQAANKDTTTMSEQKIADLTKENTELQVKLRTQETESGRVAKELEAKTAALTAKDAELTAVRAELTAVEAERDVLAEEKKTREAREIEDLVDRAILDYGKEKGIAAKDPKIRGALVTLATNDRDGFKAMYPAKAAPPAGQAHLSANLTQRRNGEPPPAAPPGGEGDGQIEKVDLSDVPSIAELVPKYMAEGLSSEAAHVKAHNKVMKEIKKAKDKALAARA